MKCNKTGKSINLVQFKNQLICPNCIPVGFMFWRRIRGEKVYRLMDFSEGTLVDVPENKVKNAPEYIQKYIEFFHDKVNNTSHEYTGKYS